MPEILQGRSSGLVAVQTEYSLKYATLPMAALFERAKDLQAPAIVIADRDVLSGYPEAAKKAEEYKIKAIVGIDLCIRDAALKIAGRLLLIPVDRQGFDALSRITTDSYQKEPHTPNVDFTLLETQMKTCRGHVLAFTGGQECFLKEALLERYRYESRIQELQVQIDNLCTPDSAGIQKLTQKVEQLKKAFQGAMEERQQNDDSLTGKQHRVANVGEQYHKAKDQLQRATRKQREKAVLEKQMEALKKEMPSKAECMMRAESIGEKLLSVFGKGHVFAALEVHAKEEESYFLPRFVGIARRLQFGLVATQGACYATDGQEDLRRQALMDAIREKRQICKKSRQETYHLKTDRELEVGLLSLLNPETVYEAMSGIAAVIYRCQGVALSGKTHYPKFPGEDATKRLRKLATAGIKKRFLHGGWTKEYVKRMEYELEVIIRQEFADYLCIVEDLIRFAREEGVKNPEHVGYVVGIGRGSAVGSLVCYLLGITGIDPVERGLIFERFLNADRVKMPDIDTDYASTVRQKVLAYAMEKFGGQALCGIITHGTMAARSSVEHAAKATGASANTVEAIKSCLPSEGGSLLETNNPALAELCGKNRQARQVVEDARLLEGYMISRGLHQAGIVFSDVEDIGTYIPLLYNESQRQWMAQIDMDGVEREGLLKIDLLELRTLDILTEALQRIYRNYGKALDLEHLPTDKTVFQKIFWEGHTTAVYQFESVGMRRMLQQYRPETIEDLTLLAAIYRPGPMQYIPTVIDRKNKKCPVKALTRELGEILSGTYGVPVYQEDLIRIFHQIAGLSMTEADLIRQAICKKQTEILQEDRHGHLKRLKDGLVRGGASERDAKAFCRELIQFGAYAFNRSHAAAYAAIAYMTAYLKVHYPAEYLCAVLNHCENKRLPLIVQECKAMGLRVLPPDLNRSELEFSVPDSKTLLYGLSKVTGTGAVGEWIIEERRAKGPYGSFRDFLLRSPQNTSAMESLILCGAMDAWCDDRQQLSKLYPYIAEDIRRYWETKEQLKTCRKNQKFVLEAKLEIYRDRFMTAILPTGGKGRTEKDLEDEWRLLGCYVSGHPLDPYAATIRMDPPTAGIEEAPPGEVKLYGMVTGLKIHHRKADKKAFAIFLLEDERDRVETLCFTQLYDSCRELLQEGAIVQTTGKMIEEREVDAQGQEHLCRRKYVLKSIALVRKTQAPILLGISSVVFWGEARKQLMSFVSSGGAQVYLKDQMTGRMWRTELKADGEKLRGYHLKGLKLLDYRELPEEIPAPALKQEQWKQAA